ncbi:hypothetical protein EJ02DRAFT_69741 [Clathrospora elynae]|uniref:Uncharacterized protein n=1 Tax=Clathrospora elynae TaxID=706981 RepID=A0A6A5S8A6_9PLEO|nr:hypothetical protein EJ02DRAFT_69741 [Clathrospora elynae]
MRARNGLLPLRFYGTFYETSAMLSRYVTIDTQVKYRKRKDLKTKDSAAFPSVAEFDVPECLTKEGIELH